MSQNAATQRVREEIQRIVGSENVVAYVNVPEAHESAYFHDRKLHKPSFAVLPGSVEELSGVLQVANRENINVVPWGGGTARYSGAMMAPENSVVICLQRMNRILEINETDQIVTVQAGITVQALNRDLRRRNLWLPHDPESRENATIGGSISIEGVGTYYCKYGSIRDMVSGVKVVLTDGRAISLGRKVSHSLVGYDLVRVVTGSEGTLGVIAEVTLRIDRTPEARIHNVVLFENIEQAARACSSLLDSGFRPEAFFIEDSLRFYYNVVESQPALEKDVKRAFEKRDAAIIFSFAGSKPFVEMCTTEALSVFASHGGERLRDDAVRDAWWHTKTEVLYQMPPELRTGAEQSQIATSDACIPIGALSWWHEQYKEATRKHALFLGGLRAYVGINHDLLMAQRVLFNESDPSEVARYLDWVEELSRLAADIGGTMTSNLGVGTKLAKMVDYEMGESKNAVLAIKRIFDPKGIMNQGKKFV